MEVVRQFRETRLHDATKTSEDIIGSIRINSRNFTDAFINNPDGGPDIYIEGSQSRSSAMEGDLVKVKLNHYSKWKLNRNAIANQWDDWSQYLLPIINEIEAKSEIDEVNQSSEIKTNARIKNIDNGNSTLSKSRRTKRSAPEETKEVEDNKRQNRVVSKLPSNLPPGISRLQVEHVIDLPFFSQCVQKTAYVIEIVKKKHSGIAGGFLRVHSKEYALFSPTDSRVPRILIDIRDCPSDFATQPSRYKNILFVAQITNWDGNKSLAQGTLVKVVGDSGRIQSHLEALLLEHQIFDEDFPPDAYEELEYLKNLPKNWLKERGKGRRDLTKECIFTIDPKTARDLDDAVSIKQVAEQIYEVGVHIADVSYFVKELTAVDYYARLRTTSVYLVDRVIPMLPRILCEQMCSLNPGEPKFTFSVIWKMNKYGQIIDEWFGRTIIKSCVKLAYEQAQDMIESPNDMSWIKEGSNMPKLHGFNWKRVSKSVVSLNKIAQNLRAKRFKDGALRIDQVKIKYELDRQSGFPTGLTFEERGAANYLIEEYMLLANMAVAKRIYKHNRNLAFLRRHPASSIPKMTEIKEFCDAKNCPIDISSSGSLQQSLNAIADPTMLKVVSFLLLRAMNPAEYICVGSLPENDNSLKHFALNVPFYTHFTSPIRRYADLIVHRLLAIALDYEMASKEDVNSLTLMADECTKRKVSSKIISDTSQKLYFNLFVQKAGFCELLACVSRIYDQSFDVILVDYDRTGRVYMDRLKSDLIDFKFESFSGVKRLVLNWKPFKSDESKTKKAKRRNKDKNKKKNDANRNGQLVSRSDLESRKAFCPTSDLSINEAKNDKQIIQVFDVIKVIVTIDEKDITQLKIDLKTPSQ